MANRLIGIAIIVVSVILLFLARDTFVNAWNVSINMPEWRPMEYYVPVVLQGIFYLIAFSVSVAYGYAAFVGQDKKRRKVKRIIFLSVACLLIILELPIYSCQWFKLAKHSFWISHNAHFH